MARAAVMLPIPPEIAAQWPGSYGERPHITMALMDDVPAERLDDVALVVADQLCERWSDLGREDDEECDWEAVCKFQTSTITLGGLRYLEGDEQRVAVASAIVPSGAIVAREHLVKRLQRIGLEVSYPDAWAAHATLEILRPGDYYTGPIPEGTFDAGTIEVWSDDVRYIIGDGAVSGLDKLALEGSKWVAYRRGGAIRVGEFDSEDAARAGLIEDHQARKIAPPVRLDRLGRRGEKWLALSEDGSRVLGEYDSEDEARERLRQVEAAKAAKDSPGVHLDAGQSAKLSEALGALVDIQTERLIDAARSDRAPAVHTKSRVHIEQVVRADRVTIPAADSFSPVYHPDGWVMYPVLYSRAGNIQTYGDVREYRPHEEVFSRASMDSGLGDPWELRHSADLLNPDTVSGEAFGCIVTVDKYRDGEHTFGWAKAWDHRLLMAIEGVNGRRPECPEVSVAYRCNIDKRPGHDDYGNPFDQRQTNIVWNSLASEPHGRAETARVLSVRADARLVRGAADMLSISRSMPSAPIRFDRRHWTPFTRTSMRKDAKSNKSLLSLAMNAGVEASKIAEAIGMSEEALREFMGSEDELTPDQVNALTAVLPEPAPAAPPEEQMDMNYKEREQDMEPPPATHPDETPGMENEQENRDMEMVKVMIGEEEIDVDPRVAKYIESMRASAETMDGRMQMAGDRADKAEARLAQAETDLNKVKRDLKSRTDAMADMMTDHAAQVLVRKDAARLAGAMELARRVYGNEWSPEAKTETRKDGDGNDVEVTIEPGFDDWAFASIRGAFGDAADKKIKRIDAAPTADARAYAIDERLADAREVLDRRAHKSDEALAAIDRNRGSINASRHDGDEDELETAQRTRAAYNTQTTNPAAK